MKHISGLFHFDSSLSKHLLNPLYTGRLFCCYVLDECICHFRGVWSFLSLLFYFLWKILLVSNVDPDQTPHHVASDLGLHCLPMTLLQFSRKEWVKVSFHIVSAFCAMNKTPFKTVQICHAYCTVFIQL